MVYVGCDSPFLIFFNYSLHIHGKRCHSKNWLYKEGMCSRIRMTLPFSGRNVSGKDNTLMPKCIEQLLKYSRNSRGFFERHLELVATLALIDRFSTFSKTKYRRNSKISYLQCREYSASMFTFISWVNMIYLQLINCLSHKV